ncbi:MAG: non-canonical purine NTP pyrophosphatase, partial [Parvibaculales bacterium]
MSRLSKSQTLIIATHNEGKLAEISALLAPLSIKTVSAAALGISDVEETGDSFAENAAIKAHHCAKVGGKPALSDDSGLCVDALEGAPGIYSARWAGEERDFSLAIERLWQAVCE